MDSKYIEGLYILSQFVLRLVGFLAFLLAFSQPVTPLPKVSLVECSNIPMVVPEYHLLRAPLARLSCTL